MESDEGLTIPRITFRALYEADFQFFDHMMIDQPENYRQSIKADWRYYQKLSFVV